MDFSSECLGTRLEHYSVAVVSEYGVMMTSLLKSDCSVLKLWDEEPLHAGYTTNTEGLVNYLLQDHSSYSYREGYRVPHNSIGE